MNGTGATHNTEKDTHSMINGNGAEQVGKKRKIEEQEQQDQPKEVSPEEKEKQEWARQMRLKFSPKEMVNEDGSLNKEYFKARGKIKKPKIWGEQEKNLLIKGISEYGIGNWDEIRAKYLPRWELRQKTMRLMGRQSIVQYKGWKGNEEDIAREFAKNKAIGEELGCWKGGMLVADDDGKVAAKLAELEGK